MLPREGRKRQNVWSAGAAGAVHWNLTQRLATLPWNWWGIGHLTKKLRHLSECLSAMKATRIPSCGDRLRREMIQDILSSLKDQLHRCRYPVTAGEDLEPQGGGHLDQIHRDHKRKLLGWSTKGHWTPLR